MNRRFPVLYGNPPSASRSSACPVPHKTGTVLFWGTEQADTFIDIEPYLDIKVDSVMAHRSQMSGRAVEDVKEFIKDWASKAVSDQEITYGEAFRKVTFRTT